jgi:hypothetical protein
MQGAKSADCRARSSTSGQGRARSSTLTLVAGAGADLTEVDVEPMLGCKKGVHQLPRPTLASEFGPDHQVASDRETTSAPLDPHCPGYMRDGTDDTTLTLEDADVGRALRCLAEAPPPVVERA